MDAYVQFVRNFLCCLVDLNVPVPSAPLWYSSFIKSGYFPSPVDETPYIKLCIAFTQFYAFVSVTFSAYVTLKRSLSDLIKYQKYAAASSFGSSTNPDADRVVDTFISEKIGSSRRGVLTGVCLFGIGPPFIWLVANSLQITRTDWIGGLPALIHALTSMEIFLIPFLYLMLKDGTAMFSRARKMRRVATQISKSAGEGRKEIFDGGIDCEAFGWLESNATAAGAFLETDDDAARGAYASPGDRLCSFDPLKVGTAVGGGDDDVDKSVSRARAEVAASIARWKNGGGKDGKKGKEDKKELLLAAAVSPLLAAADRLRYEGLREYLYFLLNFAAFYGYMLSIIVFYFDDEVKHPQTVRKLTMEMSNPDADWYGNFAGDLSWTIEPFVILFLSPFLMNIMRPALVGKSKKD